MTDSIDNPSEPVNTIWTITFKDERRPPWTVITPGFQSAYRAGDSRGLVVCRKNYVEVTIVSDDYLFPGTTRALLPWYTILSVEERTP